MALSKELQLGKAGEYRVISELIIRGHSPALVCCDNGIDIVLENGIKIQVKTSRTHAESKKNGKGYYLKSPSEYYHFSLFHGKKAKELNRSWDFIILWLIEDNLFYIVPKLECKDIKHICINKKDLISNDRSGKTKYEARYMKYKNNWEILNGGVS